MDRLLSMRVFCRVLDEGSFAAAARALDLSPAVVTRLVADLESHLGARLIQRSTRRLSVTDAGANYAQAVRRILAEIDEADAGASESNNNLSGEIRIAAAALLASEFLPAIAARFGQLHPRVRFDIHAEVLDVPSVADHDVTFLITRPGFDAAVVARHIITLDSFLVASPGYVQKRGKARRPAELTRHECLMLHVPGAPARSWTLRRGRESEEVQLQPTMTSNHPGALLRAALEGAGIAATTQPIARHFLDEGRLVRVLDAWTLQPVSVYAALPSRRFVPARVQAFLDFLGQQAPR